MDYFYLRNITEIKEEYTTFLMNIMSPFIYEGIKSVYSFAMNAHQEFLERGKNDPDVKSPGILKLFQLSLKEIQTLNNHSIEIETNRIKSGSKCADWFDDLVRAVIKSHIVLLTFSNTRKHPEILKEQFHNKIEIKDFVHKCYIESAKLIYNNPELFWHEFPPLEIKRNQREACNLIKQAIQEAIRKILPYKLILSEYLNNDFYDEEEDFGNKVSESKYMNIQSMVNRDLHGGLNYERGPNDPLGRKNLPSGGALADDEEENYYDDRGQEGSDDGDTYSDDSSTETSEDYMTDEGESRGDTDDNRSSEDSSETATEKGDKKDGFLKSVREELENYENGMGENEKMKEPPKEPPKELPKELPKETRREDDQDDRVKGSHEGGSINGGSQEKLNNEVQNLINKSNSMMQFDPQPKKKLSKRELQLLDELEGQISKKEEPDKKIFFEQYMK